ncbi:MAG: response regulator, partial [Pseudomonadota bacterium]
MTMNDRKRILVADDELRNRNLLQAILKSMDYDSETACDGADALAKLDESIDLVLLDVMMPGMDGFEVARNIRRDPICGDIPIIMVTILTAREDRLKAVEVGVNDFISKPIDKVELRIRMASLLAMKEAQDELKRHRADLEQMVRERTVLLRESEERLRAIFEAAQDCIFVQDCDLRYTHVNPFMAGLLESTVSELIGKTDDDVFGEEAGKHYREIGSRVLLGETVEEERTRLLNGIPATFLEVRTPIRDESGAITGVCGIARNITERKTAQGATRTPPAQPYPSAAMRLTLDRAGLAAKTDSMILLTGESGCG